MDTGPLLVNRNTKEYQLIKILSPPDLLATTKVHLMMFRFLKFNFIFRMLIQKCVK